MMELERIKAIEAYEEREARRLADRMRGAAILDKQIEERSHERRRQEELRDQERQQMVAELERMKVRSQCLARAAGWATPTRSGPVWGGAALLPELRPTTSIPRPPRVLSTAQCGHQLHRTVSDPNRCW
jgi:hypothetical protein